LRSIRFGKKEKLLPLAVEPRLIARGEKMVAEVASRAMSNAADDIAGERAIFKAGAVYETLKRRILDGIYPPGDWLRLSQLARDFSLSEMPIREALRLLQKDGLVVLRRYRGAQVAELSMVRGYEIVETRLLLEKAAALAAVPFHTPQSQRAMAASIRTMSTLVEKPDDFARENRRFCTLLFEPSPNQFMVKTIQDLWDQVWQHSTTLVYAFLGDDRLTGSIAENRRLLAGVKANDLSMIGSVFDDRIRLTLDAWRRAAGQQKEDAAALPR
jgi:DNA-binding GntR family transcriptional regulator